jgi:hypothetical protein
MIFGLSGGVKHYLRSPRAGCGKKNSNRRAQERKNAKLPTMGGSIKPRLAEIWKDRAGNADWSESPPKNFLIKSKEWTEIGTFQGKPGKRL